MRWPSVLSLRFRSLFHSRQVEQEMDEELRFHLDRLTEQFVRQGMSPAQARQAALRSMGGLEQWREECRDAHGLAFLTTLRQDVRYGLRQMRRRPAFTLVTVLTLALGMGAASAIFSVVNAVLLESLPYRQPGRLVLLQEQIKKLTPKPISVSAPDIAILQHDLHSFSAIAGFVSERLNLSGAGAPAQLRVARISPSLLPLLGAAPMLGRNFTAAENHPGSRVAIVSYAFWKSRLGGSRDGIGRSITLNGQPYTVVGVMPRNFAFPPQGLPQFEAAQLWVPMALTRNERTDVGDDFDWGVVGRLQPGVSLARARAELPLAAAAIQRSWGPAVAAMGIHLGLVATPFRDAVVGRSRRLMLLLMAAVGLLLLLACVNVANLLLAQASGRRHEVAVRLALGAGPRRILRQFLTESVLLALSGGLLGLALAWALTRLLAIYAPASLPQVQGIGVRLPVVAFTSLIAVATGLLFGLAPATAALRTRAGTALTLGARQQSGATGPAPRQGAFIVVQVALAVVLVAGAGLLVRSFLAVVDANPGVRPRNVLTASIDLPAWRYPNREAIQSFFDQLSRGLRTLPGVNAVGAASDLPTQTDWNHVYTLREHPTPAGSKLPFAVNSSIIGQYFRAIGVPLLRGRLFTAREQAGQAGVVLVSAGMARKAWPGEDPIGKRLKWGPPQSHSPWLTVVGVVGDVKQAGLDQPTAPHTYVPYLQTCSHIGVSGLCNAMNVALRSQLPDAAITAELRATVHRLDPAQPVTHIRTLRQVLSSSITSRTFNTFLLAVFALAALILAGIGLYGVLAFRVAQQRHELGVRLALGARPRALLGLIAGQGLRLTLIGLGLGLLGSLAFSRLLASLLYGIGPDDPLTLAAVTLVLLLVAALASSVPAFRATRVDPMTVLRHE